MGIKRHPKDRGFGYKKAYEYDESIKYNDCLLYTSELPTRLSV